MGFTRRPKAVTALVVIATFACCADASSQTPNELDLKGGKLTLDGWKVGTITEDGTRALYRSPVTITAQGYRRMWERWEYPISQTDVSPSYKSDIQFVEFDCKSRRMNSLQRNTFTGINMTGSEGFSSTQASSWQFVPPGTIAETFLDVACKLRAGSKTTLAFPDPPPLTEETIHNAVINYHKIQMATGMIGAQEFSKDSFARLSTSPSWARLDTCIAFDSAAERMDEAYTQAANLPANEYFSSDKRDNRAISAIQKMTDDRAVYILRIIQLRRDIPSELNKAF